MGFYGYYRKFIKNYGIISQPLTDLLKNHSQFHWNKLEQQSFEATKTALIQATVLTLLDFSKPFMVEIDASNKSIGVVLMQISSPTSLSKQSPRA